ncbi:MAG: hypothetical protein OJF51_004917 [Nitrospira sp.]|nr:MAG: hypothetical protein OJF51_004917 [Nitrospira sp.]
MNLFQFPLHREGLFNWANGAVAEYHGFAFSSLFIGKDFSTQSQT